METKQFTDWELTATAQALAIKIVQTYSEAGMCVDDLTSLVAVMACEVHWEGYQGIHGLEHLRNAIDVCERGFMSRLQ